MAIVVEDGTGLSNAQCYASVANLDTYLSERNLGGCYTTAQKQAALVIAAKDWIDGRHTFANSKLVSTQALQFPRDNGIGLPDDIINANAEAAWLQLNDVLLPDYISLNVNGVVKSESKGVEPLSKAVEYVEGTSQYYSRDVPASLKKLINPYLYYAGGMGRTYREL